MDNPAVILVVEDEELVRDFTVELLSDFGYRVFAAANGHEALKVLERETRIDLLFTDIVMPGNLDGFALAREAKLRSPRLQVLYTSGYTNRFAATEVGETFGSIVPKPFRPDQLGTEIRRALKAEEG
jgi:CheY-like chemotaxis protein